MKTLRSLIDSLIFNEKKAKKKEAIEKAVNEFFGKKNLKKSECFYMVKKVGKGTPYELKIKTKSGQELIFSIVNKEVEWDYLGYTTSQCSIGGIVNQIKLQKHRCECLYPPNNEEEGKDHLVESEKGDQQLIIFEHNKETNLLLQEGSHILVNVKKNIKRIESAFEQQENIKEYLANLKEITINLDIYVVNGEANDKNKDNTALIETFKEKKNVVLLWLNYADTSQQFDQSLKEIVKNREEFKKMEENMKADLTEVKAEVKTGLTQMKAEVAEVKASVTAGITEVKTEMKAGITEVKADVTEIQADVTEMKKNLEFFFKEYRKENHSPNQSLTIKKCFTILFNVK